MSFIEYFRTISVLPTFEAGILPVLEEAATTIQEPDYKTLIPAQLLRRMSKILRLGAGCALATAEDSSLDGIVVGSGIGCYQNSITFTNHYLDKPEGALSPTAFIQSTDNAIAGQIAIALGNHGYNNTYIHKGIAFENALLDAHLLIHEGKQRVLVGAVDEWIPMFRHADTQEEWIGEGSTFFRLVDQPQDANSVELKSVWVLDCKAEAAATAISDFLHEQQLSKPDLILSGRSFIQSKRLILDTLCDQQVDYSDRSGIYFTNSAFGMQLGTELLMHGSENTAVPFSGKSVLVVNNFNDELIGLIYLSRQNT